MLPPGDDEKRFVTRHRWCSRTGYFDYLRHPTEKTKEMARVMLEQKKAEPGGSSPGLRTCDKISSSACAGFLTLASPGFAPRSSERAKSPFHNRTRLGELAFDAQHTGFIFLNLTPTSYTILLFFSTKVGKAIASLEYLRRSTGCFSSLGELREATRFSALWPTSAPARNS